MNPLKHPKMSNEIQEAIKSIQIDTHILATEIPRLLRQQESLISDLRGENRVPMRVFVMVVMVLLGLLGGKEIGGLVRDSLNEQDSEPRKDKITEASHSNTIAR